MPQFSILVHKIKIKAKFKAAGVSLVAFLLGSKTSVVLDTYKGVLLWKTVMPMAFEAINI